MYTRIMRGQSVNYKKILILFFGKKEKREKKKEKLFFENIYCNKKYSSGERINMW